MTKEQAFSRFRLLNEKEFSELTGITVSALRSMRARPGRNGPPYIQTSKGAPVRYLLDHYQKWLEQNTVDSSELKSTG